MEEFGSTVSYRVLRNGIREYYRRNLPFTGEAANLSTLNPGNGWVSRLCHDPRVSVAVLHELLAPYELSGKLVVLYHQHPIAAWTDGDRISAVAVAGPDAGWNVVIEAPFFIDATPLSAISSSSRRSSM